jgi:hypothetical protein
MKKKGNNLDPVAAPSRLPLHVRLPRAPAAVARAPAACYCRPPALHGRRLLHANRDAAAVFFSFFFSFFNLFFHLLCYGVASSIHKKVSLASSYYF